MNYKMYIDTKLINANQERNHLRKDFMKKLNQIIIVMGNSINQNKQISKEEVLKYIKRTFIFPNSTAMRYFESIKDSEIFNYNLALEIFTFPDLVTFEEIKNDNR